MKIPGPDHPITITPHPGRVRVSLNGTRIAETTRALALQESTYPKVLYIPRDNADMATLKRTARTTHCPYKGDASYFSIDAGGPVMENAVWSYETPYPAMREIAGCLAFYPDKVTIETLA